MKKRAGSCSKIGKLTTKIGKLTRSTILKD